MALSAWRERGRPHPQRGGGLRHGGRRAGRPRGQALGPYHRYQDVSWVDRGGPNLLRQSVSVDAVDLNLHVTHGHVLLGALAGSSSSRTRHVVEARRRRSSGPSSAWTTWGRPATPSVTALLAVHPQRQRAADARLLQALLPRPARVAGLPPAPPRRHPGPPAHHQRGRRARAGGRAGPPAAGARCPPTWSCPRTTSSTSSAPARGQGRGHRGGGGRSRTCSLRRRGAASCRRRARADLLARVEAHRDLPPAEGAAARLLADGLDVRTITWLRPGQIDRGAGTVAGTAVSKATLASLDRLLAARGRDARRCSSPPPAPCPRRPRPWP